MDITVLKIVGNTFLIHCIDSYIASDMKYATYVSSAITWYYWGETTPDIFLKRPPSKAVTIQWSTGFQILMFSKYTMYILVNLFIHN